MGAAIGAGEGTAIAAISVPVPAQRFAGREDELAMAVQGWSAAATDLIVSRSTGRRQDAEEREDSSD